MLDEWIQRVRRRFFNNNPPTMAQERHARETRHDLIVSLQQDVRRLQQEISDLSDQEGAQETDVESDRMRTLHRQLQDKQTELARYQARI